MWPQLQAEVLEERQHPAINSIKLQVVFLGFLNFKSTSQSSQVKTQRELKKKKKKVITKRTYQDFPLRGHRFAAELQQAVQIAKVFGFSDQGQTLLQFPFSAARVTLCNLRGKHRVHVLLFARPSAKITVPTALGFLLSFPFLRGRTAWCIWTCSRRSRIPQWSRRTAPSPASVTWTGRRCRTDSVSPTFS